MFIVDIETKGNVVRLFLGDNPNFTGEDWHKCPLQYNAGRVYAEYIKTHKDITFPFDYNVVTPENAYSQDYRKNDFKNSKILPYLIVYKDEFWETSYESGLRAQDIVATYYLGQEV